MGGSLQTTTVRTSPSFAELASEPDWRSQATARVACRSSQFRQPHDTGVTKSDGFSPRLNSRDGLETVAESGWYRGACEAFVPEREEGFCVFCARDILFTCAAGRSREGPSAGHFHDGNEWMSHEERTHCEDHARIISRTV